MDNASQETNLTAIEELLDAYSDHCAEQGDEDNLDWHVACGVLAMLRTIRSGEVDPDLANLLALAREATS